MNNYKLKQTGEQVQKAIDNALNPDKELSASGVPADAAVVGEKISELSETIVDLPNNETLIDNVAEVVKTEIPLVKSAEEPTIVDSVDEMTDTSKHYVLSTNGYFYKWKEGVNYNLLKLSEVSYSSRLQDDAAGITSSTAYNAVTGWIPVEYGKNYCGTVLMDGNRVYGRFDYQRMNLKLSDGTIIVYNKSKVPQTADNSKVIRIEYENAVALMLHFSVSDTSGQMLDISTSEKLGAYQPMIVEGEGTTDTQTKATTYEYIDGDEEVPAVWYKTGLAYNQPADYEDRIIELESDVADLKETVEEIENNVENPASASPYYRNSDFGVIPVTYYQGMAVNYENQGFVKNTKCATFIAAWKNLIADHSSYITETELGAASDGQSIYLYNFKPARITNQNKPIPKIIIIAGQHGFEKSNIYGLYYFVDNLLNRWTQHPVLEYLRNHVELMIIPVLNTYGFDNLEYKNANGVNLNRNYNSHWELTEDTTSSQYGGAEPFDQPETQFVRDLLADNTDALLVVDFHTNGGSSVTDYSNVNWCAVCESTDSYYNRIRDSIAHHLSAITAHFNLDYELNQPDTMMGHMTDSDGTGLLRNWATDNNIIGVLIEGFNGFPNRAEFIGAVYKANEEIIVNYLMTAMYYLAK